MFAGENTAYLRYGKAKNTDTSDSILLDISSANSTDKFYYTVHYTAGGVARTNVVEKASSVSAGTIPLTVNADIGTSMQVEVHNEGTGEVFYSNSLVKKAA